MKRYLLLSLLSAFVFSSCNSFLFTRIEKRKHLKGYNVETAIKFKSEGESLFQSSDKISKDEKKDLEEVNMENVQEKTDSLILNINSQTETVAENFQSEKRKHKAGKKKKVDISAVPASLKEIKLLQVGLRRNTAKISKPIFLTKPMDAKVGLIILAVGLLFVLLGILLFSVSYAFASIAGTFIGLGLVMFIVGLIAMLINMGGE